MNWRKIGVDIVGGSILAGIWFVIVGWAKTQYLKGRIDAATDIMQIAEEELKKLEKMENKEEEEA